MGAFGELLIKTWGGNLNLYKGSNNHKSQDAEDRILAEKQIEELREQRKIDKARNTLTLLSSEIMYGFIKQEHVTKDKFETFFRSKNAEENIIELMWGEYQEFLEKYVKK